MRRHRGEGQIVRSRDDRDEERRVASRGGAWSGSCLVLGFGLALVVGRYATERWRSVSSQNTILLKELESLVHDQNTTIAFLRSHIEKERSVAKARNSVKSTIEEIPSVGYKKTSEEIPSVGHKRESVGPIEKRNTKEHSILDLSQDEIIRRPMDELMAPYGLALGGGSCERDFGNGLIHHWRDQRANFCSGKKSQIECFLVKQKNHHGDGDNLCLGHHVQINFGDLADGKTAAAYFDRYVSSRHQQQHSKIRYSKGSWKAACSPVLSKWKAKFFPGWNVNWFNAFQEVEETQCDIYEKRPTLIIERDTFANFFHNSEDFFNTQIALAILRWPLKNLQILITDLYPKGPFWPMWQTVFNDQVHRPLDAYEIAQKYQNKNICFDQAAIAILGAAAPITVASFNTKCSRSAIVRAYADLVISRLGLSNYTRYTQKPNPKRVVVTFMARRAASAWPEKRFCDSKHSFFKCEKLAHLGVRKLGRSVRNDAAVVTALKALSKHNFPNGAKVIVQDIDYSTLDFNQQILTDLDTDVMVGPHGAGLLHNIFMPDRAALVELFIDSSQANRHFHNFAKWQGRKYFSKPMPNPIPTQDLVSLVSSAISSLDLSKPY